MHGVEPPDGGNPKSPDAFRTIGEVSEALAVPQHVLRFWRPSFPRSGRSSGAAGGATTGPRMWALLRHIRHLLHDEGFTVRGVQKLLRERASRPAAAPETPEETEAASPLDAEARARANRILDELCTLRDMLRGRTTA